MQLTDVTDFFGVTNTKSQRPQRPEEEDVDRENLGPQKILLEWKGAPKAATVTLNPRYKKTFMIIGGVVMFLLFLMQEFLLILVVASLYFVSYMMSKNPIGDLKYTLSTHGLSINNNLYYWDEIEKFFFSNHYSQSNEYLAVDLKEGLPSRLIMGFNKKDKDKIIEIMKKHVTYLEEEPLTFVDKAYKSVLDRFDLEKEK